MEVSLTKDSFVILLSKPCKKDAAYNCLCIPYTSYLPIPCLHANHAHFGDLLEKVVCLSKVNYNWELWNRSI